MKKNRLKNIIYRSNLFVNCRAPFSRNSQSFNSISKLKMRRILSFKKCCKPFLKESAHVLAASVHLPTRWRRVGGRYERWRLSATIPSTSRPGSSCWGWWGTRIWWSWCHMATGAGDPSHSWRTSWRLAGRRRRERTLPGIPIPTLQTSVDFLTGEFLAHPGPHLPPPVDKAVGLAS